ncbi:hypothetical protein JFL43_16490 [Viridibacillus sp. YIM B01967]|uniref:Uncharacterized protein n=1 Tax=Viridibacillus soli TaxID=2798301 RepID=A0ABS1HAH1_9BACL|nr:hypothetical protein [Viridibacillus soli]MBK3496426.1 hypothetical protein [Viridibacillus soli]
MKRKTVIISIVFIVFMLLISLATVKRYSIHKKNMQDIDECFDANGRTSLETGLFSFSQTVLCEQD